MFENLDNETQYKIMNTIDAYIDAFDDLMANLFKEMSKEFNDIIHKKFLCSEVAGYASSKLLGYLLVNCGSEQSKVRVIDIAIKQAKEHEQYFLSKHECNKECKNESTNH